LSPAQRTELAEKVQAPSLSQPEPDDDQSDKVVLVCPECRQAVAVIENQMPALVVFFCPASGSVAMVYLTAGSATETVLRSVTAINTTTVTAKCGSVYESILERTRRVFTEG
jgi:hypothetical protein